MMLMNTETVFVGGGVAAMIALRQEPPFPKLPDSDIAANIDQERASRGKRLIARLIKLSRKAREDGTDVRSVATSAMVAVVT
jgi:hypothetical protein